MHMVFLPCRAGLSCSLNDRSPLFAQHLKATRDTIGALQDGRRPRRWNAVRTKARRRPTVGCASVLDFSLPQADEIPRPVSRVMRIVQDASEGSALSLRPHAWIRNRRRYGSVLRVRFMTVPTRSPRGVDVVELSEPHGSLLMRRH